MQTKYFILLAILATAALYIYQDEALQKKLMGKAHQVVPELNSSTLYKWQNSKGEWQVTDKPPAKGISYTTVTTQDQINVISDPSKQKK